MATDSRPLLASAPAGLLALGLLLLVALARPAAAGERVFAPLARFETAAPALSVALIREPQSGRGRVIVAHGPAGMTGHRLDGRLVWQSELRARLVAGLGAGFMVYWEAEGSSALTRYSLGPDGTRSQPGAIQSPSEVARKTLRRSAHAALGSVEIAGDALRRGENIARLEGEIAAVAALDADLGPGFERGAVATVSPAGSVRLYPLPELRSALGP